MANLMQVTRDAGWNFAAMAVSAVMVFLVTPPLLRALGPDHYGLVVLFIALSAPLLALGAGVGQAMVRNVASAIARADRGPVMGSIRWAVISNTVAAGALALPAIALAPWIIRVFAGAPVGGPGGAISALIVAAAAWPVTLLAVMVQSLPTAVHRFDLQAYGVIFISGLGPFAGLCMVWAGYGVLGYFIAQLLVQFVGMAVWTVIASRLGLPMLQACTSAAPVPQGWWRYVLWTAVGGVGGLLAGQTDKFVLAATLPSSAVAFFGIAQSVEQKVYLIGYKFAEALFPTFSASSETEARAQRGRVLVRSSWMLTATSGSLLAALAILAPDLLTLWLRGSYDPSIARVLTILCVAGIIGSATNVVAFYLLGSGRVGWATASSIATGSVVVIGSLILIPIFGLDGAGVSNILAMVVQLVVGIAMWWALLRDDLSLSEFASATSVPVVLTLAIVTVGVILKGPRCWFSSWVGALGAGVVIAGVTFSVLCCIDHFLPGGRVRDADRQKLLAVPFLWVKGRLTSRGTG